VGGRRHGRARDGRSQDVARPRPARPPLPRRRHRALHVRRRRAGVGTGGGREVRASRTRAQIKTRIETDWGEGRAALEGRGGY
jgi:hypothetical protein